LGYSLVVRHLALQDEVYGYARKLSPELVQLERDGKRLKATSCDVSSTESVSRAMADVLKAGRQIDILYNVAGVFRFEDKVGLAETDLDLCANMYNINAVGALRVCRATLPLLRPGTLVVNISSEAGSIAASRRDGEYGYCMSKAAMNMGAKIMSNELAGRSVRVLLIHPGWMRTAMGGEAAAKSSSSVSPEESARDIVDIAERVDELPKDLIYMTHKGEPLPW
jgi:NAD(P)-dependent dehydrogenase (short-subunit alcohol dehydrogenase family)